MVAPTVTQEISPPLNFMTEGVGFRVRACLSEVMALGAMSSLLLVLS